MLYDIIKDKIKNICLDAAYTTPPICREIILNGHVPLMPYKRPMTGKDLFKKYDAVILPVSSGPAKKLDGDKDMLSKETVTLEEHLQVGNFGGFPSITIPDGFINKLPVALNITGNCYDDENVLNIAYAIESAMDYKGQIAKEVK